jgi:hypothetical protein
MPPNEKGEGVLQKVTVKLLSPEERQKVEEVIVEILEIDERHFGDDYERVIKYLKTIRCLPEDTIEEFRRQILAIYLQLDLSRRNGNGKQGISPPSSPPIPTGNTNGSEFADSGVGDLGEDSTNGPQFDCEVVHELCLSFISYIDTRVGVIYNFNMAIDPGR